MRRTLAVIGAIVGLAGCGGESAQDAADRSSAEYRKADQRQRKANDATYEAQYAEVLNKNAANAARYCVRKIGAETGTEQPPSRAQRKAEQLLLSNAADAAKSAPTIEINGGSLSAFLNKAANILRTGGCDTKGAARLEDLALRASSAGG